MKSETALTRFAYSILDEREASQLNNHSATMMAKGWSIESRNLKDGYHLRLSRGNMFWAETLKNGELRSTVMTMINDIPDTMKVEGAMSGKPILNLIELPDGPRQYLEGSVITRLKAEESYIKTGTMLTIGYQTSTDMHLA